MSEDEKRDGSKADDKGARPEKGGKAEKPEKDAKSPEKPDKGDKGAAAERPEKPGKKAAAKKATKPEKPDKPAKTAEPAAAGEPERHARRSVPALACVAMVVAALAVGLLVGRFLPGSSDTVALSGKTVLSESELDSTIATYTYNGETHDITSREIIDEMGGTDEAANDDGTYNVPAAGDVVTYAQNQVILEDAEDRGLTATDEEVAELAEETFGTSDYETISSTYGYDEEYIGVIATITKLRDAVVDVTVPDMPTAPDAPADGEEDVATAEYASYVIDLLGDEWDSETDTWASTDGDYYATLSSYEFTSEAATYDVAEAAYQVAYSAYTTAYSEFYDEWTTYTRNLLSNATIQIGSLVAS